MEEKKMMKYKRILSLAAALLLAAMTAGCGQSGAQTSAPVATPAETATQPSPEPTPAPSEPEAQSTEASSAEITITDVAGRTVTLPAPAQRLVGTHNPTMNQAVILGGGGKYIAGFGNKSMASGLYEFVYPELKDVLQIGKGGDINFESCLAVEADLAILPERFQDLADHFEAVGITAAVVLPNEESFDTIKSSLRMVAALIGEEEKAEKIITFYDNKISAAAEIVKAKEGEAQPAALYLGASSQLSVANGIMLQSLMLETAGAVNAAKELTGKADFVAVTIEEIIGWNPDIIYVPVYADYTVDDILTDEAWSSVKAVQDQKVFTFPCALEPWDYPTPSSAMGLSWLMNNLHPELYSKEQVLQDAKEYYEMVYGQSFTAEQLGLE